LSLRNEFKEALLKSGFCGKAVVAEEGGECVLYYCDRSLPLLIAFSTYGNWVYAKLVAERLVRPYMWHCSDVFFNPYGLYVFARSLEELVEKFKAKEKLLVAQASLGVMRLAKIGA